MDKRRERTAFAALFLILIGMPAALLGYEFVVRPALSHIRIIDIRAAAPEAGGFQPGAFDVRAGETVTLRFRSEDVTHGIAIGPGLQIDLGQVDPGHVKEVTLTFDRPGTYTFYCNTWCSLNHWRMRGVIEVREPTGAAVTAQRDPVIEALATEGVNIDASLEHDTGTMRSAEHSFLLDNPPSAQRGASLFPKVIAPPDVLDATWRRSHTPAQALDLLLKTNPGLSEPQLADVVAYLWTRNRAASESTQALYAKNCAACHGERGKGDGFAGKLTIKLPVAFADPQYMFTMRSDVLYAKIRRGGMGTDMPNFGTLFTPEETWDMVDYLWKLAFSPAE